MGGCLHRSRTIPGKTRHQSSAWQARGADTPPWVWNAHSGPGHIRAPVSLGSCWPTWAKGMKKPKTVGAEHHLDLPANMTHVHMFPPLYIHVVLAQVPVPVEKLVYQDVPVPVEKLVEKLVDRIVQVPTMQPVAVPQPVQVPVPVERVCCHFWHAFRWMSGARLGLLCIQSVLERGPVFMALAT